MMCKETASQAGEGSTRTSLQQLSREEPKSARRAVSEEKGHEQDTNTEHQFCGGKAGQARQTGTPGPVKKGCQLAGDCSPRSDQAGARAS